MLKAATKRIMGQFSFAFFEAGRHPMAVTEKQDPCEDIQNIARKPKTTES